MGATEELRDAQKTGAALIPSMADGKRHLSPTILIGKTEAEAMTVSYIWPALLRGSL